MNPTVRCSDCGAEIEMSRMGEHVCPALPAPPRRPDGPSRMRSHSSASSGSAASAPARTGSPAMSGSRSGSRSGSPASNTSPSLPPPPRLGRPPKIDSSTANRSFTHTPSGLNPSRSKSPARRAPMRSATSPLPRIPMSPPSPELSNLDCAFPPFPIEKGLASPKPGSPHSDAALLPGPSPSLAPMSPKSVSSGSGALQQRMDKLAQGPFAPGSRPSIDSSRTGHSREDTSTSSSGQLHRRATAGSKDYTKSPSARASSAKSRSSSVSNGSRRSPPPEMPPPMPPPPTQPQAASFPFPAQSNTRGDPLKSQPEHANFPFTETRATPSPAPSAPLPRRPSEPAAKASRRPTETRQEPAPPAHFPPRSTSRKDKSRNNENRQTQWPGLPPPTPVIPETISTSTESQLHTPRESHSSSGSSYTSEIKTGSSRSSPPLSDVPEDPSGPRPPGFPKDASIDTLMSDIQTSMQDLGAGSAPRAPPQIRRPHEPPTMQVPPPSSESPSSLSPRPSPTRQMPESPMDPAVQGGYFRPQRPPGPGPGPDPGPEMSRSMTERGPGSNRQRNGPPPPRPGMGHGPGPGPRPGPPDSAPGFPRSPGARSEPSSPRRRQTTGSKGNCRGCGEPIKGKSVSSADGRITGRYHRHCFVCRTCKCPFETSEFYVHANLPYCERHYHQLNNSICQNCNRGIEGQYLETERRQKYHAYCFCCQDCRRMLREDYFEISGRVYCEVHAFKRAQQSSHLGPGRKNPERRRTRLMMM